MRREGMVETIAIKAISKWKESTDPRKTAWMIKPSLSSVEALSEPLGI